jgi:hypothetical protein
MSASTGTRTRPESEAEAKRALEDLASTFERDRGRTEEAMKEARAGLDALNGRLEGGESGSGKPSRHVSGLEARLMELAAQRQGNRELLESGIEEVRRGLDELAPASEVASIREQLVAVGGAIDQTPRPDRDEEEDRSGRSARTLAPLAASRAKRAGQERGAGRFVRLRRRLRHPLRKLRRRSRRWWLRRKLFGRALGVLTQHQPKKLKIPRRYRREIKLENPPVISIVTPTFNTGSFIERTMLSILDQDYPRLEYIVQDGGSTDETEDVLKRHGDRLHHFEMRPDDGHAHAVNLGFEHATGNVMGFLNADDVLLPGSLHYVARYFERHPEVDLVYGHRVIIDENDMEIGRWVMPRHHDEPLRWADFVPQETMFWRRRLWERSGARMDQDWPFALDWELLVRFMDAGAKTVRLPRFLGGFRVHAAQKTTAIIDTQGGTEMRALRERIHGRKVEREEVRAALKPYMRRHVLLQKLHRAHVLRY